MVAASIPAFRMCLPRYDGAASVLIRGEPLVILPEVSETSQTTLAWCDEMRYYCA